MSLNADVRAVDGIAHYEKVRKYSPVLVVVSLVAVVVSGFKVGPDYMKGGMAVGSGALVFLATWLAGKNKAVLGTICNFIAIMLLVNIGSMVSELSFLKSIYYPALMVLAASTLFLTSMFIGRRGGKTLDIKFEVQQ